MPLEAVVLNPALAAVSDFSKVMGPSMDPKTAPIKKHGIECTVYNSLNITPEIIKQAVDLANHYLPPEEGGKGSDKGGIVEMAWSAELVREWLDNGGHLYMFNRENNSGGDPKFAGMMLGCYADKRMAEEAGSMDTAVEAYNQKYSKSYQAKDAFWVYYQITPEKESGLNLDGLRICDIVGEHLQRNGVRMLVADYMIPSAENPHTCLAGKKLMELVGFKDTGATYDNSEDPEYVAAKATAEPLALQNFALMARPMDEAKPVAFRLLAAYSHAAARLAGIDPHNDKLSLMYSSCQKYLPKSKIWNKESRLDK